MEGVNEMGTEEGESPSISFYLDYLVLLHFSYFIIIQGVGLGSKLE